MKKKLIPLMALSLALMGILVHQTWDPFEFTSSSTAAPKNNKLLKAKTEIPSASDTHVPRAPKVSFPKVDGWPVAEEDKLGIAEQRMLIAKAKAAVEHGAIAARDFDRYLLEERRATLESIQQDNESPAERVNYEGEIE